MFDLNPSDLRQRILDCGAGPSSFNAELHNLGLSIISCDPVYQLSADAIQERIDETYDAVLDAARRTRDKFIWRQIRSIEDLGARRRRAMEQFLHDFPAGVQQGRYLNAELPHLPFRDAEFDLVLCSHFLFTYSNILSLEFHLNAIRELCRVGKEARIFPLVDQFGSEHSPYVAEVLTRLGAEGFRCGVMQVAYEFQKGGNEMIRIRSGGTLLVKF